MEHNPQIRQNHRRWLFYDRLDSTNREVLRQCKDGIADDGLVIYTDEQYEGQGQRGRTWASEKGQNIAMSLFYRPENLPVDHIFIVNEMVAVVVAKVLAEATKLPTKIKWPNDIYIDRKKVAGLLVQNGLKGKMVDHLVIGIGINVHQEHFPAELVHATSMKLLTGRVYERSGIMKDVVGGIDQGIEDILCIGRGAWHEQFQDRMFLRHRSARFLVDEEWINGRIIGVDDQGRLILETPEGRRTFNSGNISYDKSSFADHRR